MFAEARVGDAEPEMELVVVGHARHLAGERLLGAVGVARLQRRHPALEVAERRLRIELLQPRGKALRIARATELAQHRNQVGHRQRVCGLLLEHVGKHALGLARMAVAQVDHAQRVVRDPVARRLPQRLARPPVRVVAAAGGERLDRPVVHVHRDDDLLADRRRAQRPDVARRKEVDRGRGGFGRPHADAVADAPLVGASLAEDDVDVPDRQVDVAAARERLLGVHLLVFDVEAEFLGERRGHDDQRQAVA